jgi:DNA polymerase
MGLRLLAPPASEAPAAAELATAPALPPATAAAAGAAARSTAPPLAATSPRDERPAAPQPQARATAAQASAAPVAIVPAAAPAALAGLDWHGLREAVAACRACGLCEGRTQTVFGVGSTQAQWMVVGEAPGEQEDRAGEPFVGAAGQLLDRMLAALQLTRAEEPGTPAERQVYIANTLKCRPPGNRNPAPEELARCEPFLARQIELLRPRLILAMGRYAVQALLQSDEPIGRLRGRVHRARGVPLVVTYHPAYLLRNLPEKAKAWDDLCFAAEVFERGA